ncbi:MAG: hypothetical protein AAEJ04_10850 [Planctomycetota bacterium]
MKHRWQSPGFYHADLPLHEKRVAARRELGMAAWKLENRINEPSCLDLSYPTRETPQDHYALFSVSSIKAKHSLICRHRPDHPRLM